MNNETIVIEEELISIRSILYKLRKAGINIVDSNDIDWRLHTIHYDSSKDKCFFETEPIN